MAKLSGGDVVAQELKYHPACLAALYNRKRAYLKAIDQEHSDETSCSKEAHPLAFSELLVYINETKHNREGTSLVMFKLADLAKIYKERLEQLGVESPNVHSNRLKDKLMAQMPELESHRKGRDVLLAFRKDIGPVLSQASDYSDAIILSKAASILRSQMLNHKSKFNGNFNEQCIDDSVPPMLQQFVSMIEHGADIKSQLRFGASKTDLAMAQLLQYNCYGRCRNEKATQRHSKDRETPFPVYIGMAVYARTRKRHLVEMLHDNGISISYDRVLEISAQLGEAVVTKYVQDGVVCPPRLRQKLFTTSVLDNIDHNPTATTASTSFHGTSISIFQHPSADKRGEVTPYESLKIREGTKMTTVPELPEFYTNIPPAYFTQKNPYPPQTPAPSLTFKGPGLLRQCLKNEYEWLEKITLTEEVDDALSVTWSAHHAAQKRSKAFEVSITALLPLLRDQAHSVATIKHVMDKVRDTVAFLNPGQTPVIGADQPLYALAKQIQWHWPGKYGEDKFVLMFGGLHIEMAAFSSIGSLLKGSGWTSVLTDAGVASSGTAESFLTASSVTRTRQAHQVTAASLYRLMKTAYTDYCNEAIENSTEVIDLEDWCEQRKLQSPQFQFWYLILSMELTILALIRSFREANFELYCDALSELIPYFFANNNINYARWLPIHLRDMMSLEQHHPQVASEFRNGNFVVHKSCREFSALAIDQAHEQANAVIKGDGGAIGVTEDPSALRRWMVAGPEVSHLVAKYEVLSGTKDATRSTAHHERTVSAQRVFLEKVGRLTKVISDLGNPFQEESNDLLTLDTKDIAHTSVHELVSMHYDKSADRFCAFMKDLESQEESLFYKPLKKNKLNFFKQQCVATDTGRL